MDKKLLILSFFLMLMRIALAQEEQDSTVREKVSAPLDSLTDLSNKIDHLTDSLSPDLSGIKEALDSIRGKLSFRIDSLNALRLPTGKYTRLLDSLNQIGPAKTVKEAENRIAKIQNKVDALEVKVNSPANKLEQKINGKLNLMKSEGGDGANLPGNVSMPGVDAPDINNVLPSAELNQSEMPNSPEKGNLPGLPNLNETIPGLDELNKAQQGIGEVTKVTGEISAYSEDVKNMTSGNLDEVKKLPETIESQAVKAGDAGQLQEQAQVVEQYKDVLASGNNPEALKQEVVKQVPKMAANHFKGKEQVLQQAIDKVNSYKSKYTELTDLENIPKHQPNQMKGKPLVERLVPAITLQIQNSNDFLLDYNVAAGYRVSKRFTAGLGWNERVGITNKIGFTTKDRVFGPRTFFDFKLKKGFALRIDIEKMNVFIPPSAFGPSDFGQRQWIWSAFVGMKKDYDFVKSVKGNFQFLYNLYDDHGNSPYFSRLIVRFGFEFPLKKKEENKEE